MRIKTSPLFLKVASQGTTCEAAEDFKTLCTPSLAHLPVEFQLPHIMPTTTGDLQVRQLEAQLAEAGRVHSAAALEARNSLQAAASDLQNARQEAQVLRASAGSHRDQALADLKVEHIAKSMKARC